MKNLILLSIAVMSTAAMADSPCVLGSYAVVGNTLRQCEQGILNSSGSYTMQQGVLNKTFLEFLYENKNDKALSERLKRSIGVTTDEAIQYFESEIQAGNYYTKVTADGDTTDDLKVIAGALNDHYGYTEQIARQDALNKAKREDKVRRDSLKDGFKELDLIAERNGRNVQRLRKSCESNPRTELAMDAIEVRFKDNGAIQYAFPLSTVSIDGSPSRKKVFFVDDEGGIKWRIMEIKGDQMHYVGKDGKTYDVEISKVSSARLGTIRGLNDNRSNACYLAALAAKGPSDKDGGSGAPEAVRE